jgi:hypothetical protein
MQKKTSVKFSMLSLQKRLQTRSRMNLPNIKKATYDKLIVNIILNGEKLKPFSLNSGRRQVCPPSLLLLKIVLEFLVRAIWQEEGIKKIANRNGRSQTIPIYTCMILYLKDPRNSKKTPRHHNSLSKLAGYKINLQKSEAFLYTKQ